LSDAKAPVVRFFGFSGRQAERCQQKQTKEGHETALTGTPAPGIVPPMWRRNKTAAHLLALGLALIGAQSVAANAAEPPQKPERPALYDTSADGKEQIAAALKTAKAEDKRVILKFGANW